MTAAEQIKSLIPLLTFFLGMLVVGGPWFIVTVQKILGSRGLSPRPMHDKPNSPSHRIDGSEPANGLPGLNGVTIMKSDYLPTRTMVVSHDLFDVMKGGVE